MKARALAVTVIALTQVAWASDDWCKRPNDSSFNKLERERIAQARRHLEDLDKKPLDACYEVRSARNGEEVWVHVTYVAGYRDGAPLVTLGGHAFVLFDEQGKLLRAHRGE